ncbi:16S rRNA (guanine(527)-N(7))-methyltransferase RsmG [Jatrophihabitans sp. YIM 134969]
MPDRVEQSPRPEVPEPPADAAELFGDALPGLEAFARILAGAGIERGLLGPREVPRLWDRHLVNSAAVAQLIPQTPGLSAVDVGSGAGLPGLVVALVRPELAVTLVDATRRRTAFLAEAVAELGLTERVRVVTGRVEERAVRAEVGRHDIVLSRAVAELPQLARWCLPLVTDAGTVLAVKGARARDEVAAGQGEVRRAGGTVAGVTEIDFGGQITTVVELRRRPRVSRETGRRGAK